MLEVGGGSVYREIDKFVVTLSTYSTDSITAYTGVNNISVIHLSYQLHCLNSEVCPNTTILPQCQSKERERGEREKERERERERERGREGGREGEEEGETKRGREFKAFFYGKQGLVALETCANVC